MSDTSEEGPYSNIREILGRFIGHTLVDITQHDREDFQRTGQSYIQLMFDDSSFIKFPIGDDGFWSNDGVFCDTPEEE